MFFLLPASVPTSFMIPPQTWPGGTSTTVSVCNMDNAPAVLPNTTLTVVGLR